MSALITPDIAVSMLRQTSRNIGIALPAELDDDLKDAQQLAGIGPLHVDHVKLKQQLLDHVIAGTDPLEDDEIRDGAMRLALQPLYPADLTVQRAGHLKLTALRKHTPAIIESWAKAVDDINAAIIEARQALPGVDLAGSNSSQVSQRDIVTWSKANQGIRHIALIAQAWDQLGGAVNGMSMGPRQEPFVVSDPDYDQYIDLKDKTAAGAAAAGIPLHLATFEEFRSRRDAMSRKLERERELSRMRPSTFNPGRNEAREVRL